MKLLCVSLGIAKPEYHIFGLKIIGSMPTAMQVCPLSIETVLQWSSTEIMVHSMVIVWRDWFSDLVQFQGISGMPFMSPQS